MRHHLIDGVKVDFTPEEEIAADAVEAAAELAQPAREMTSIREHRDNLLAETDWMALGDVTMSDAWKTYRQLLRDIPASNTIYADVTWPTTPL